jgi:hypothetical protein
MKIAKFLFLFCVVILAGMNINSQDNSNGKSIDPVVAKHNWTSTNNQSQSDNSVEINPSYTNNPRIQELNAQIKTAKVNGDLNTTLRLIKERETLTPNVITKPYTPSDVRLEPGINNNPPFQPDYNQTLIRSGGVRAFATATEHRGANVGRIWVLVVTDTSAAIASQIFMYYSDNGGSTWANYAIITLGGTSKISFDELDVEIIENTTGAKYMWMVWGERPTGGTGNYQVQMGSINITTLAGGFAVLAWPGNSTAKRYYRPRITTDNSNYPSVPYLFCVASFDSVTGSSLREVDQKYLQVNSLFTTTITPTYRGNTPGWWMGAFDAYQRDLHSDIAYYQNGTDSVMMLYSNCPDSTKIFLTCLPEDPAAVYRRVGGTLGVTYHQQFGRIASNGHDTLMIVSRRNFTNSGDWDIYYYRSFLGGITGASWANGYIDSYASTATVPYAPDLVAPRIANSTFRCVYTYLAGFDSVKYSTSANGTSWTAPIRVNDFDAAYGGPNPHVGYKIGTADDCAIYWSQYTNIHAYMSRNCLTTVGIGNHNGELPKDYSLAQNYPNPFNPNTNIKFSIPSNGMVKLTVFDITGRQVAVLVNENLNAGTYTADFNAANVSSGIYFYKLESGSFVETKKMMLIK